MDMMVKLTTDVPGLGVAGDRVSLAGLTPVDVLDPTEIPTYLAGYSPFAARADEGSPVVLVDKDLGEYRQFSENDAFRRVNVKASDQSAVREVDPSSSLTPYRLINRMLGGFCPQQTEEQAVYNVKRAIGRRTMNAMQLDREHDVWDLLGTAANWNANVRLAIQAGQEWNVSGDPILDIQSAVELAWQPVTGIWLNQKVANTFLRHVEVRAHMRQMLGDQAVSQAIANVQNAGATMVDFVIPGLPPFHVAGSKEKNDTTGVLDYCLGNVVVLTHQPPGIPVDGEDCRAALTFRRRGAAGVGLDTREYRIEGRGPLGGVMQVVSTADVNVMPANMAGAIITNVIDPAA